jgi:branched-chain amino acid transport system ATP-binding protein
MIGPNGAGKTTLFNLLTGQLKPSAGKVFFNGREITHHSVFARTHLGMARSFQITSLFPNETVLVNAMIGLQGTKRYGLFGTSRHGAARGSALLETVELWDLKTRGSSLAYGQQRKLDGPLSGERADLLMLDEPGCGLTTTGSADITGDPRSRLEDHRPHDRPRHGPRVRRRGAGHSPPLWRDSL